MAVDWDSYKAIVDARFTVVQETNIVNLCIDVIRSFLYRLQPTTGVSMVWFRWHVRYGDHVYLRSIVQSRPLFPHE
jgi:hypothetical protein